MLKAIASCKASLFKQRTCILDGHMLAPYSPFKIFLLKKEPLEGTLRIAKRFNSDVMT